MPHIRGDKWQHELDGRMLRPSEGQRALGALKREKTLAELAAIETPYTFLARLTRLPRSMQSLFSDCGYGAREIPRSLFAGL